MSPVLASSSPILIVSAAVALAMNGLASGAAAIAAAPSSALRRGTTSPDLLADMNPPMGETPSMGVAAIIAVEQPAYRVGDRQATRLVATRRIAAPEPPCVFRRAAC